MGLMVRVIYGPQEHHGVRDVAAYRQAHARAIARKAAAGARVEVHTDPTPCLARVDANTWLVDCDCGAGNATDPAWGLACCYGCGAVHEAITFPADVELITAVLVERPRPADRAWRAGETLVDLARENVGIDRPVPDGVVAAIVAAPRQERDHTGEIAR